MRNSGQTSGRTSTVSGVRSGAAWIASAPVSTQRAFIDSLSEAEIAALPWLFEFWALGHQLPPDGDWRTWVILGGRGAGKTRAGAEWVRGLAERGEARRIALVAETYEQAREVMVFGDSGLLAVCPPEARPAWIASRRLLVWPGGAEAQLFSAADPERLRGPQFDAAWADELAKWPKAEAVWDMLQFALRLGEAPRCCVTTTPRPVPVLKALLARDSTVSTHAPTQANRAHLAASFLEEVEERYGGTALGRQELSGELLEEIEGALWSRGALEALRIAAAPPLSRVVVAVDPPASSHARSDACGIVVAGVVADTAGRWRAVVLEDATVQGARPAEWAAAAVAAFRRHGADRLVAEVNQGGDMVEAVLRQVDPLVPVRRVHATRGKVARAEPVAALYEQGRVRHLPGLQALEDEMCRMTVAGYAGGRSPDRVDALVWALSALMEGRGAPQVRAL